MRLSSKKQIRKTSYHFSSVDGNADMGWGLGEDRGEDGGNFLTLL
jgi:hypothetical protein